MYKRNNMDKLVSYTFAKKTKISIQPQTVKEWGENHAKKTRSHLAVQTKIKALYIRSASIISTY